MSDIPVITPSWPSAPRVIAYTTTRAGGVSTGPYASLNVGDHVGDAPSNVAQNRRRLPYAEELCWLRQVHSDVVVTLPEKNNEADAAISRTPGTFCAVMTADCVPILLCNQQGTEVAAIHAGWKGLENGIIGNTVRAMHSPAKELFAWIGPAISANHYEVDTPLAQRFVTVPNAFKAQTANKAKLDLPGIAHWQLTQAGVGHITPSGLCTYADEARFFSHRRATHQGQPATGRMVSIIGICDKPA